MSAGISLDFNFIDGTRSYRETVTIRQAVIAGWTARDKAAMEHHIHELAAIGVKPPSKTPLFYRVGAQRLTTAPTVEALGGESSGEVETVLVQVGGRLWVGAGSDHTDRQAEAISIPIAKQLCDKPVAPTLWPFESVVDHWDELVLRSWIDENGQPVLYQEGTTAGLLRPETLLKEFAGGSLPDGTLMFGGTLAAKGGVRPSPKFAFELVDERTGRRIAHSYKVIALPIVD
jgi:hypothetical protein